ncbi:methyltransferase domain-containing protein [Pendulispora rubella]|uniref:Methyltransferase domain-containing protein n=1 Tax=Pendulispora rubella TaxID=2741070 RepID=A0ABZ2KSC0_9BACT
MGLVWNAELYDAKHAFVAQYGADLFEVLAAKPGERVLDVGCGTGDHVALLSARGVAALGVDASPEMIERARAKYPEADLRVADVRSLGFEREFDAVVSNAVLHWVHEADAAAHSIAAALKAGGRFVAELGGAGNVAILVAGVQASRAHFGLPPARSPWYFPTVAQYAAVLERAGLEVREALLFDRPTKLEGDDGIATWVRMFGHGLLADVADADALLADASRRLAPQLHRDGHWFADYRRLRIVAVKPPSP